MIRCAEIGQYINHLKGVFMDNCKHIKPGDLRTMVDIMDAVRRCGNDGSGGGELPEDAVLYTPQEREEFEKEIARLNIGATSTSEVINIINNHVPELVELLGYESLVNKQNSLDNDGTGTKYPTVDAVNNALENLGDDKNFVYEQLTPSDEWIAYHGLNKKVSPIVTDSAGTVIEGQLIVNDGVKVIVRFNFPFTGFLICN